MSKIFCNKKYIAWMAGITQNTQLQYYTYTPPPPPTHTHTCTHTPQRVNTRVPVSLSACIYEELTQWYIFSYYCTGLHKYCIVNVKDCNTYLYIFLSKTFDPDTVPLKWDLVQLLQCDFVLYQDTSDNAYSIDVDEYLPICKYLFP